MLLVGLCWLGMASAEIYRWVDEKGQVHYSDRPNPKVRQIAVEIGDANTGKYVVPEDTADAESGEAAVQRTRAEQCKLAQERLASYRTASSVVRRDEAGEETEIGPDEKVQLIVKTEQQVKALCTDSDKTAAN